ncbi:hypothetical protein FE257_000482 [Aspergillus nanangensis]|uniref:DUF1746 domain-containing protein n=1 Tax=Aspergillus nanangensis TaxID=2582783 RepID=A0AAD4CUE7_ASPNN|nr:hypothetical protein FE257_000482 [Aspergillus nanangensis]
MTTPDVFRDAEYIADVSGIPYGSVAGLSGQQPSSPGSQEGRMKKAQSSAKVAFIDRLLRDLDILIYCELSVLYYMDNLFCMVYHKFFNELDAGEATRGYLHGGILIDFIGQKAPVPLARLLLLDVLVLILDLVMLGLIIERVKTAEASTSTPAPDANEPTPRAQDHDLEERGVLRNDHGSSPAPSSSPEGIEFDELATENTDRLLNADETTERTQLLADPSESGLALGAKNNHPLDSFSSGEAVIVNMGFLDVIRDQWRYSPAAARRSSPYVPSDQTAAFLRERFGLQVNADGRVERIAPGP